MISLKKVWVYIKKYWFVPLIVVAGIGIWILSAGRSGKQIWKLLENTREAAQKEIEAIENAEQQKNKEVQEANRDFIKEIEKIEQVMQEDMDKVKERKKKQVKKDIEDNNEDATDLAQGLQDLLD